ncbi:MAG: hypothetical protein KDC80_24625 [Saprospiraceae bacterium]|nr:hypothetical protein [Saprospiraceae bacterium]
MDRRVFLCKTGISGAGLSILPLLLTGCKNVKPVPESKSWGEQLLGENDLVVSQLLERQVDDPLSPNYGGIADSYQIYHPGSAAGFIERLTVSYVSEASAYFHMDHLVVRMQHTIDFLLKNQHEDGTIDLLTTNFHSTPDTGFVVEPLALSFKLLDRDGETSTGTLRTSLKTFLIKAGKALQVGGIHTPNHRWVVSMAMARIHELFPDSGYISRIDQWLNEGIDMDTDGQYTERSTAVYSPLTDRCLITIATILKRPYLLDPVRKNLDMTMYYIHPNGEIATEASRRQDQYLARTPEAYYYPYRFLAMKENNPQFGGMVQLLEENIGAAGLSRYLAYLLEHPEISGYYIQGPLPDNYEKFFQASDLVRIRRGLYDATVLGKNSALFTFSHSGAVLQAVRMATAFFGKGQFVADEIKKEGSKYVLTQDLGGPYYQPIDEDLIAADGSWEKMPRDQRPQSEIQKINYALEVVEIDQGFQLSFSAEGTDRVPVAIEMSFRKGGVLQGGKEIDGLSDAFMLSEDAVTYQYDEAAIQISGALHQHDWTQLRGAEERVDGVTVYLTGFTPFRHQVTIKAV